MKLLRKITLCFFLMFAVSMSAQTYAKYTTSKGKGTATAKKEKPADTIATKKLAAKEKPVVKEKAAVKEKPVVNNKPVIVEKPAEAKAVEKPEEKMPAVSASFNDLYSKAKHLYKEQKYAEAVKAFTEALEVCPEEWEHLVLQFRGNSYFRINDYNKAIADCTTAIEKTRIPNKLALGNISFLRAMAYKSRNQAGDNERACADYKKAKETGYVSGEHNVSFNGCE